MSATDSFRVDATRCCKDGICARVCPLRIITGRVGELPRVDPEKAGRCIRCGHCMAFCPTGACVAPKCAAEDMRALRPEAYALPEQLEELVFARRSIRNFRDRTVPREVVARILDAVRFAPTGHNTQSLRWIVTESREQTAKVAGKSIDWFRNLPQTDPERGRELHSTALVQRWDSGYDIITRCAPHLAVVVGCGASPVEQYDAGAALTYFELLALAHGIGCCWGGFVSYALAHPAGSEVRDCLGIGPGEIGFSAQMFGYAAFKAVSRPPRDNIRVTWK